MSDADDDALIAEQIAYYRARAEEYDDWWTRSGRYDAGAEFNAAWHRDIREVELWLESQLVGGHVLEIAAGTGNWTPRLLRRARSLDVLDSSPEALDLCRAKLGDRGSIPRFHASDMFTWIPPRRYDVVFCAFWISHIPASRWRQFWDLIDEALAPQGTLLLVESAHPDHAVANGPSAYQTMVPSRTERAGMPPSQRTRRLEDGRTYRVEKNYWTPDSLRRALVPVGWEVEAANSSFAFIYARVSRDPRRETRQ